MLKLQARKDGQTLPTSTSQEELIQQLTQKVETLTSEKDVLQDLIVEMKKHDLQKDQRMEQLQQTLDRVSTQLIESKGREEKMLESQKESKPILESIQKYTKPGLYTLMGSTLVGDLLIDLYKEVVKNVIGEERFEACGSVIREVIGPWLSSILDTVVSNFPTLLLIIKAAIALLVIAAPSLNLTVSLWQAAREGLAKLRGKKASK